MLDAAIQSFLTKEDLLALDQPAGVATGMPGVAYGRDFFELEKKTLFPRSWCAVAFTSDIPDPGDAIAVDLAGWPLLVVRGEDKNIRVFYNICRHRGMKVVPGRCHKKRRLTCPWHGWVYGLDGKLVGTPRIGGSGENNHPEFNTTDLDLNAVRSATWLDLVFVNLQGNAPAFEAHIAPLEAELVEYNFSGLAVGERWSTIYPGNWKVAVESAIEDYHVPLVHPQIMGGVADNDQTLLYAERCFFGAASRGAYNEKGNAGEPDTESCDLPTLLCDPTAPARRWFGAVFPTAFFQTRPNYMYLTLVLPDGHRRTKLDFRLYFKGDAAGGSAFKETRSSILNMWQYVFAQDLEIIASVQENAERPGAHNIRPRFSPVWETNVLRFQQSVIRALTE